MWRTTNPNLTPQQVAQQFVDELFPGREIAVFSGQWAGLYYSGGFMLQHGTRSHSITADQFGNYEIEE